MKSGDIKQVTMNVEVAGTPVTELVSEVAGIPVIELVSEVAGIPVIELVSEVVGIPGTELVPIVEQELPTLLEHMSSPPVLVGFVLLIL